MLLNATKLHSRTLSCYMLARKAKYCVYQWYYNVQLLNQSLVMDSFAWENCKGLFYRVNFCTVQVLVDPKNLSTLQNTHFRSLDCTQTNVNAFETKQSVRSIVDGCFLGVPSGQGSHCTCISLVRKLYSK